MTVIAVDGPAASGKGTIARALAAHFGLPWLDTGLLYRAVGVSVLRADGDPDDPVDALAGCDFPDILLDDPELRSETAGTYASRVSVHPVVRAALIERQKAFADQPGGAVLDGRDIGTVIAPHAHAKLFVEASAEARADRRYRDEVQDNPDADRAAILADIEARDRRDSERASAPLKRADDADLLDTTNLTISAAVQRAIALVEARTGKR
ncbi:d(CMP) kinase [Parasphingopyxis sp.]|uniref:(d)CMP kinase n=1 Tax=Parasphingopyxis sp. TaxID=1920299 RepID=UPI0026056179|nr:d(CMP) kinase [Parasphingopyxis sp.]